MGAEPRTIAIVVAAGSGERMGSRPKQYRAFAGEPVLRHSLRLFAAHPGVEAIQPVIHRDHAEDFRAAAAGIGKCLAPAIGGPTRQR